MTGVGHVQDGPRPAATEVGPGGTLCGTGRLPPLPPAPRCPGAQQSATFCTEIHALLRLRSLTPPSLEELHLGFTRQLAGPTATEPAGETLRTQISVYVNRALCSLPLSSPPSQPLHHTETTPEQQRQDDPLQPVVFCRREASLARFRGRPSRQPAASGCVRLCLTRLALRTRALPASARHRCHACGQRPDSGSVRQVYGRLDFLLKVVLVCTLPLTKEF